jgi:hypothetical protein
MGEAAPNISDIDKDLELPTEISKSIKNMVRNYKSRTNLHRKTIISEVRANKAFLIHVMKISVLA